VSILRCRRRFRPSSTRLDSTGPERAMSVGPTGGNTPACVPRLPTVPLLVRLYVWYVCPRPVVVVSIASSVGGRCGNGNKKKEKEKKRKDHD